MVPENERFCKLCLTLNDNHIEDEYHVLLRCPFHEDLRKYIDVMHTQNQEEIVQLACFVSSMFKLRYCYLRFTFCMMSATYIELYCVVSYDGQEACMYI